MNSIFRNYIYNGLYQFFVLLVPLVTAPYLARVLGPSNLGIYSYVSSSANLILNLGLLGLYDYGCRQIAYCRDNQRQVSFLFFELFGIRLVFSSVVILFYLLIAHFSQYRYFFYCYLPWIIANCLDCSWLFVGEEDMGPTCLKNFLAKLVGVVCIFAFVKEKNDLWIYFVAISISTLLANTVVYAQLGKYVKWQKIRSLNLISHLKGSLQFFFPQLAMLAYLQIDKIMMAGIIKDTAYVGFFDQAEKIVQIPLSFVSVVSTVIMPRIANEYKNDNGERINYYILQSGCFMLFCAFPLAFGIAGIAPHFVPWYLGQDFGPSIIAIIGLCPIIIANALSGLAGKQYLVATNKMNVLLKSYATTACVNILLNVVLLPTVGWYGAIIATDISAIVCAAMQMRELRNNVPKISMLWRESIPFFLFSLIMLLGVLCIGNLSINNIAITIIQIFSGICIYFLLLYLTRNKMMYLIINRLLSIKLR